MYYLTVQKNYFLWRILSGPNINGAYKLERFKSINRRIERYN